MEEAEPSPAPAGSSGGTWFPRPRGAAPHGPGGIPKRWSNSLGIWEAAEADGTIPKVSAESLDHKLPQPFPPPPLTPSACVRVPTPYLVDPIASGFP